MPNPLKQRSFYIGIVRYVLGIIMMAYGITKILRTQFILLPVSIWQQPLEEITGMALTWAFLGYAPWFQVLLGFLEFIPAFMLLFRRTTLIGTLLLLPMTLNVFLMNIAMDLWISTQFLSAVLLGLNILLALMQWERIQSLVPLLYGKGIVLKKIGLETGINLALAAGFIFLAARPLIEYRNQTDKLMGDWFNGHAWEWKLVQETVNDSVVAPRKLNMYFMPYGMFSMVSDTATSKHRELEYKTDEANGTIVIRNAIDSALIARYHYRLADSILYLQDSADHILTLKRRVMRSVKR